MSDGATGAPLLDPAERSFLERVARLYAANPFERKWNRLLRDTLGPELLQGLDEGSALVWGPLGSAKDRLSEPLARSLAAVAERLRAGASPTAEEIEAYRGAAIYRLWDCFGARIQKIIDEDGVDVPFWDDFVRAHRDLFDYPGIAVPEPEHLLSLFYQARRACWFITTKIAGRSRLACRSRAAIWRAILGSDVCAYARELYRRMHDFTVLITGETGTGKDLAAECIGWSGYIPFDVGARRFAATYAEDFHVRNLCEVPSELLESTLFGHRKGSFTGAFADAPGCLGLTRPRGVLFLDEIGEIPLHVQAKLLRPLQNREFVPLGDNRPRKVLGRFVFATLRDLEAMCQRGEFRADLYERMNGFRVHMPSLRELRADGGLLDYVGGFVAARIDDPDLRCTLTLRVMRSIQDTLADHDWPRNLRELKNYTERCLVAGESGPDTVEPSARALAPAAPAVTMGDPQRVPQPPPDAPQSVCVPSSGIVGWLAKDGGVDHEELIRAYVTQIYFLTGQNKAETARRSGFDRRTVDRYIDPVRLARLLQPLDKSPPGS